MNFSFPDYGNCIGAVPTMIIKHLYLLPRNFVGKHKFK